MEHSGEDFEALNASLDDPATLAAYAARYADYRPGFVPRLLGGFLIWCGNAMYGRKPSYLKFRSIEVIARVPYHSWESAAYTLLTLFYRDEARALRVGRIARFARLAKDNETMHVVVISKLAAREGKANALVHTVIPLLFAFFYFWAAYWLYLMSPRQGLELNYLFEKHAFEQYSRFLDDNAEALKKKPVESAFLAWYGRTPANQYEFFRSVRNDEVIHRNASVEEIEKRVAAKQRAS